MVKEFELVKPIPKFVPPFFHPHLASWIYDKGNDAWNIYVGNEYIGWAKSERLANYIADKFTRGTWSFSKAEKKLFENKLRKVI